MFNFNRNAPALSSLLVVLFMLSCTTSEKRESIVLPATVESLFATCSTGDGALNIQVYDEGDLKGSGDLEWIANLQGGWKSQLINPVGRSLLKMDFDKPRSRLNKSGILAQSMPPLKVVDEFLEIDGYFVGIMPDEIPCYLKFRLPRSWLANVYRFTRTTAGLELEFRDDYRTIVTKIAGTQPEMTTEICSTISWSSFLGMVSRDLEICNNLTGAKSGKIRGLDELAIKWVNIDG